MSISRLPEYVVLRILVELRAPDILSFCSTNRLYHGLCNATVLQMRVELQKRDLEPRSASSLSSISVGPSLKESLDFFKRCEGNWCLGSFGHVLMKPFDASYVMHTFESGYLVVCRSREERIFSGKVKTHYLDLIRLPRCAHNAEIKSPTSTLRIASKDDVLAFKVVKEFDLVVVALARAIVEYEIIHLHHEATPNIDCNIFQRIVS